MWAIARMYTVITGALQQASDSDMILVHDNDLGFIGGVVSTFTCLSHYKSHPLAAAVRHVDRTHPKTWASHTADSVW